MIRRRSVSLWTVAWVVFYSLQTFASDWPLTVKAAGKQIPRIEVLTAEGIGRCSGVIWNAEKGVALSAAHCFSDTPAQQSITLNGKDAQVARLNRLIDVAILRYEPSDDEQTMPLAKESPVVGIEIALIGWAFGSRTLHAQFGHVAAQLDDDGALVLDVVAIGGDSGGAAINAAGELIGMTSAVKYLGAYSHVAVMVPVSKLRQFASAYLPPKS